MADGGDFGIETIRHFNGNLFDDARRARADRPTRSRRSTAPPSSTGAPSTRRSSARSSSAAWTPTSAPRSAPTTPAARTSRRSSSRWSWGRCGGSGTRPADVVEQPAGHGQEDPGRRPRSRPRGAASPKAPRSAIRQVRRFLERLAQLKVLDPACGSGNFLYVTLQKLKDLEKEVDRLRAWTRLGRVLPQVGPRQLYGIEINPYAHDLAQMTVWIGYLQWIRANGFPVTAGPGAAADGQLPAQGRDPRPADPEHPREPEWPQVDFIVGNPPFLGGK